MGKNSKLTITLAIVGTVLVWMPILATILTAVPVSIWTRSLHFDYLMPAELFPAAFAGGALLLWAALRARSHRRWIAWSLGLMVAFPVAGSVLATVTGLASGETEPAGLPWALVLAAFALYTLAVIAAGAAGLSLLHLLFRPAAIQPSSG